MIHQLQKLPHSFYTQKNVCNIAKNLLGKILVTQFNETITACTIVETEAYNGIVDKASHSYKNKRTTRTEIMFANGGLTYVYLCYGIHYLFNVVTNTINQPHAVLIRAGEPVFGIETMLQRTGKIKVDYTLTKGPGNLCKSMGINTSHNGLDICGNEIFIVNNPNSTKKQQIITTKRIGVDYAEEDALLPYRFILANNLYVSGKKTQNIAV